MLEDLDLLAARLGQLVQQLHQLQSERTQFQQRSRVLEQERDAARDELQRRASEHADMAARTQVHESALQALRDELEAVRGQEAASLEVARQALQAEQEAHRQSRADLEAQLAASRREAQHLRQVASSVDGRIESLLMRLPGAPQE